MGLLGCSAQRKKNLAVQLKHSVRAVSRHLEKHLSKTADIHSFASSAFRPLTELKGIFGFHNDRF